MQEKCNRSIFVRLKKLLYKKLMTRSLTSSLTLRLIQRSQEEGG